MFLYKVYIVFTIIFIYVFNILSFNPISKIVVSITLNSSLLGIVIES